MHLVLPSSFDLSPLPIYLASAISTGDISPNSSFPYTPGSHSQSAASPGRLCPPQSSGSQHSAATRPRYPRGRPCHVSSYFPTDGPCLEAPYGQSTTTTTTTGNSKNSRLCPSSNIKPIRLVLVFYLVSRCRVLAHLHHLPCVTTLIPAGFHLVLPFHPLTHILPKLEIGIVPSPSPNLTP
jgi:hypothetical protein